VAHLDFAVLLGWVQILVTPLRWLKKVAFIAGKSENQADKKILFVFPLII
jgi:hypothetical protein